MLMSVQLLLTTVTEMLCVQTLKAVSVVFVTLVSLVMVYHVVSSLDIAFISVDGRVLVSILLSIYYLCSM